jgi:Ca2+-binding EF-hand superfamily protein
MNTMGSKRLDKGQFREGLSDYGVTVSPAEADAAFGLFDRDGDAGISYDEFLIGLRGTLNESRASYVDKAFAKMDTDVRMGVVRLASLYRPD